MENEILKTINYDITYPTIFKYLEIYKMKLNLNDLLYFYCWYCIELSLLDYNMIKYKNSVITTSACYLTLNLFKNYNEEIFKKITKLKIENLINCSKNIMLLIKNGIDNLQAIKIKFSLEKYMNVANMKFE